LLTLALTLKPVDFNQHDAVEMLPFQHGAAASIMGVSDCAAQQISRTTQGR